MSCLYTCGLCICNPPLCNVGICAATANPGSPACGGISMTSCGMSQVTIAGSTATNWWPWLLGGAAAWYLLSRHR